MSGLNHELGTNPSVTASVSGSVPSPAERTRPVPEREDPRHRFDGGPRPLYFPMASEGAITDGTVAGIEHGGPTSPKLSEWKNRKSMEFAARRLLQLPHHGIQVERRRLLARRELDECLDLPCATIPCMP